MSFNINQIVSCLPDNWITVRVGDVADINSNTIKKGNEPIEIGYIDISSVSTGTLESPKSIKYCNAPSRAKRRLKNNDFIISTVRPNLRQHVLLENVGDDWIASTGFCVVSAHNQETSWYLYSFITSDIFTEYLVKVADGGAYPAFNSSEIEDAIIPWPDRNALKEINGFAKTIANKININTQIIQTLESITQSIFTNWFVNFEPVKAKLAVLKAGGSIDEAEAAVMCTISCMSESKLSELEQENPGVYENLLNIASLFPYEMKESEIGEVPDGWTVGALSELIDFNPKRVLRKGSAAPYLDMKNVPTHGHLAGEIIEREMGSGTKFTNGDTLLARITPCLENGKTAFVDFLKENEVGWGSTEYIVMHPKEGYHPSLGYFIARNDIFRSAAVKSMTGTSGRQRTDATALGNLLWVIYPKKLVAAFSEISEQYLKQSKNCADESRTLRRIRDLLMPRLLSGETEYNASIVTLEEMQ